MVGAVINFLGVPAGLIGNELSIRYGLRTIATLVFVLSAVAAGLFGFTAMLPYIAVLGLAVVAGFIVQGNFSNLTSGVLSVAAPRYGGATIGLYSCIMLLGWRSAFVIAGTLGAAGVLIAWAALPRGDSGREEEPQPLLDFRPVLANRDVLALMVGYAAAIWGCVDRRRSAGVSVTMVISTFSLTLLYVKRGIGANS